MSFYRMFYGFELFLNAIELSLTNSRIPRMANNPRLIPIITGISDSVAYIGMLLNSENHREVARLR